MKYKKVFFSYSRTDTAFAIKLALDLKKDGYDVWIDQEDIRAGSEWDMQIEQALSTCDCLVYIQSEKSAASQNVLDEVYYVLEENKPVIPVLISESKAPFRIKRLQYINFINNYETGLQSLKDTLSGTLPEVSNENFKKDNSAYKNRSKYVIGFLVLVAAAAGLFYFLRTGTNAPEAIINKEDISNKDSVISKENFTGNWILTGMQPDMSERKGYLKIEDGDDGKLNIKTSVQFYYPKANDTAYHEVFNAFAECKNCTFKNEIALTDKQVDVGSQRYIILKEDEPGKGKAGDTILNAGLNTAVKASVVLHLSKNNVLLTISKKDTSAASYGITIPPFEYAFFFKKDE